MKVIKKKYGIQLVIGVISITTLFFNSSLFVEEENSPQQYAFMLTVLIGCIVFSFYSLKKWYCRINVSWGEFLVLLFSIYLFVHSCVFDEVPFDFFLFLYVLFCLYILLRSNKCFCSFSRIAWVISISILGQALFGIYQYFFSKRGLPVLGSFDNPAGFGATLVCGVFFTLYLLQLRKYRIKVFACISLVFLLFALILSGSRASFLACVGGIVYFYWNSFTCKLRGLNRYSRLLFICLCVCVILGLYFMKKDSADGRLFIWRCTWDLFKERPYLGYGEHGFTAQYMFSQANYFKGHENEHFEFLADNVKNPFNEYLRLLIQRGLLGVLFTGLVVLWYWKNSKRFLNSRNRVFFSLLLALGINSFFSYPFRYVYVWLCLVIIGAYMEQGKIFVCRRLRYFYLFWINVSLSLFSVYYLSKNIYGEVKWKQLVAKNQLKKSDACIIQYEKLYDILYGNPYFHYNYAVVLFELEHYQESRQELKVCQAFLNDMDTQLLSADINIQMGYDDDGENDLVIANYMCPNRFMPIYKLMLLSEKRGCKEKACEYARIITEKPVKIPSFTVTQIKAHALKRIRGK